MSLPVFLSAPGPLARLRVTRLRGSAPRPEGTEMFARPQRQWGSIGGGRLEYLALEAARAMLAAGEVSRRLELPLGPEIGQCCGGHVTLEITALDAEARAGAARQALADLAAQPVVCILGAGHVGRALADLCQHLPLRPRLIDSREAELARSGADVDRCLTALPEAEIAAAPPRSAFVVMTHDHGLDFLLTAAALARGDAAYVGLIGSASKRARFESWARDHGGAPPLGALICPIGAGGSRNKHPAMIAAQVLAEILTALEPPDSGRAQIFSGV